MPLPFANVCGFGPEGIKLAWRKCDDVEAGPARALFGGFPLSSIKEVGVVRRGAIERAIDELRHTFRAGSYHVLKHNCCSFAMALAEKLELPSEVLRDINWWASVTPNSIADRIHQIIVG